jgi:hypothetical protein
VIVNSLTHKVINVLAIMCDTPHKPFDGDLEHSIEFLELPSAIDKQPIFVLSDTDSQDLRR